MKQIKLLLLCIFIATSNYTSADNILDFISLGGDTHFNSIDVLNTSVILGDPIIFKRGSFSEFKCSFIAPYNCPDVKVKCYLVINGVSLPIPVQGDSSVLGMTLPLREGQSYICHILIPWQNSLQVMACKLRIELHTKDGEKLIAGADMDVKIQ
mgnify:CR=1 FL=1